MAKDNQDTFYGDIANQIYEKYLVNSFQITNPDFKILSTIRYDPNLTEIPPVLPHQMRKENIFLFEEHYNRLIFTLEFFNCVLYSRPELSFVFTQDHLLETLFEAIKSSGKNTAEPMKIRLLVSCDGDVKIEVMATSERINLLDGLTETGEVWDVYFDKEMTLISPFTSFKTTNRKVYIDARERSLPGIRPGKEEVILINTLEHLMEGSITNIAVKRKRDGKWITPQLSSGCLCGVMRHFLLRKNYLEEETIAFQDVAPNSEVLLFNGVIGVVKGKIVS